MASNADIMSDMKTFTVRDLDRAPSAVLAACDREGEVRIRCRDGRTYRLAPEPSVRQVITTLPDFEARRHRLFPQTLSREQTRLVDQMLRGE